MSLILPAHLRKLHSNKVNLYVYFHTSLWCLKRFYEGLKGRENKNLS